MYAHMIRESWKEYRCWLGTERRLHVEFYLFSGRFNIGFEVGSGDDAIKLTLCLALFSLHVGLSGPFLRKFARRVLRGSYEGRSTSFRIFDNAIWWECWAPTMSWTKGEPWWMRWTWHAPWTWEHVRHTYLNADGSVHHDAGRQEYQAPAETKAQYSYRYVLKNGTAQDRVATVNGDEREWRWRWFKWSPWPRKIRRSIDVSFNDEVGERTGSWKGGTVGCGYDWLHGETQEQALRRMERERTF
jgi:hypothetical protein